MPGAQILSPPIFHLSSRISVIEERNGETVPSLISQTGARFIAQNGASMQLKDDFVFEPLPALETPVHFPFPLVPNPLGPLAALVGSWGGKGFNVIWRPTHTPGQVRFLELNL